MYKVFVNNKLIKFEGEDFNPQECKYQSIMFQTSHSFEKIVNRMNKKLNEETLVLVFSDPHLAFQNFKNSFRLITAGGGIVKNSLAEVLLIQRFGMWDLPKGKVKKKESHEKSAIREVEEETSVKIEKIISQLPSTFHMYLKNEKWILKETIWFEMFTQSMLLVPQEKEGIEKAEWFDMRIAKKIMEGSYASLRELFRYYSEKPGN